jgi:CRP-like cAMP-binding protein
MSQPNGSPNGHPPRAGDEQCAETWHPHRVDLFAGVPSEEIERLIAPPRTRRYRAGETIMRPESPVESIQIVLEGSVRLFHQVPDGREITIALLGPGRLVGVSVLLGPEAVEEGLRAEAVTDATVCLMPGEDVRRLMERHPEVMLRLTRLLVARLLDVERRFERLVGGDARGRLGAVLAELAARAGVPLPEPAGAIRVERPPTHLELAREIGTSRETVTRALAALEADGLVRREGRSLVILDPARVADASGGTT